MNFQDWPSMRTWLLCFLLSLTYLGTGVLSHALLGSVFPGLVLLGILLVLVVRYYTREGLSEPS